MTELLSAVQECAQQCVHPTSGTLRVFRQFVWLEVDSVKIALSRPTHLPVTQAVGRVNAIAKMPIIGKRE
jgi:hypothetical protein